MALFIYLFILIYLVPSSLFLFVLATPESRYHTEG